MVIIGNTMTKSVLKLIQILFQITIAWSLLPSIGVGLKIVQIINPASCMSYQVTMFHNPHEKLTKREIMWKFLKSNLRSHKKI